MPELGQEYRPQIFILQNATTWTRVQIADIHSAECHNLDKSTDHRHSFCRMPQLGQEYRSQTFILQNATTWTRVQITDIHSAECHNLDKSTDLRHSFCRMPQLGQEYRTQTFILQNATTWTRVQISDIHSAGSWWTKVSDSALLLQENPDVSVSLFHSIERKRIYFIAVCRRELGKEVEEEVQKTDNDVRQSMISNEKNGRVILSTRCCHFVRSVPWPLRSLGPLTSFFVRPIVHCVYSGDWQLCSLSPLITMFGRSTDHCDH